MNTLRIGETIFKYGEIEGGSVCKAPDFKEPTDPPSHTFHRIRMKELKVYLEGYEFTMKGVTVMFKGEDITTPSDGSGLTQEQRDRIDSFAKKD